MTRLEDIKIFQRLNYFINVIKIKKQNGHHAANFI